MWLSYSAPSCKAFEIKGSRYSFLTQAVLEALNSPGCRKKINGEICPLIMKCLQNSVFCHSFLYFIIDYRGNNLSLSENIPYARPWILNQLAEDISLEDPIHVVSNDDIVNDVKDLLLGKC